MVGVCDHIAPVVKFNSGTAKGTKLPIELTNSINVRNRLLKKLKRTPTPEIMIDHGSTSR